MYIVLHSVIVGELNRLIHPQLQPEARTWDVYVEGDLLVLGHDDSYPSAVSLYRLEYGEHSCLPLSHSGLLLSYSSVYFVISNCFWVYLHLLVLRC